MGGRHWTDREDAAIRSFWNADGIIESHIHQLPGRTRHSVIQRARVLKLGPRHHACVAWTPAEDELLRLVWSGKGSLKSNLHRIPGRTWRGCLVRARTIGLNARTAKQRASTYSWVDEEVERILSNKGALTVRQISEQTTASRVAIQQALRRNHHKKYHIEGWTRTRPNGVGSWWPKWAIGADDDVPKPKKKSPAQVTREWRAKQKIKAGEYNPFAIAMNQVIQEAA